MNTFHVANKMDNLHFLQHMDLNYGFFFSKSVMLRFTGHMTRLKLVKLLKPSRISQEHLENPLRMMTLTSCGIFFLLMIAKNLFSHAVQGQMIEVWKLKRTLELCLPMPMASLMSKKSKV